MELPVADGHNVHPNSIFTGKSLGTNLIVSPQIQGESSEVHLWIGTVARTATYESPAGNASTQPIADTAILCTQTIVE